MSGAESAAPAAPVDWARVWQEAHRLRKGDRHDRDFWNKRAPSFASHARESAYVPDFIRLMSPRPEWSVLDVGSGAGTLAIPLSGRVRRVTAIDFSETMLGILAERCREKGIDNVTTRLLGWEDDWDAAGIGEHDVAIASRSLVIKDLATAIDKLAGRARKKVIISSLVGDGPFDRRIFRALGRELDRGPDYICVYNLLHQMGIHADVTFVSSLHEEQKVYRDLEEAATGYSWMLGAMTAQEQALLREYLARHLVAAAEGMVLDYHHLVRWAVLSWEK